ncbi:C4-dicarboxylate transporter DctQ subunit [Rhodovulum imhoffii]|uniref:TRAP transporter small permease protein n=1 Tax=Rhodovulum imhoffii TaxID=365340 RepID=A0A2T5BNU4_9RHOB|nr:TRAP transporter small permease [Rhodovulum imhoffii]MBK5933844.1 TRAP transporter permease DctQ [Rhodovulum imhoffii]PTN00664.1 C4-dicarboxylate transporter DctQ subunit [Rhodovulum imhoffii]
MSGTYMPKTPLARVVHAFEENVIALLLGLMALITFVNVVLRYIFNSGLIWGLELTLVLFAWLVMFGIAYGFKITMHLGVDALLNIVGRGPRRLMALLTVGICLIYALLLMKGAYDYWAPYANLAPTTGRWFPTGFEEMKPWDFRGYVPTERIPVPGFLRAPLEALFLPEGEDPYEKLPIVVPYTIIPVSVALMVFRLAQAAMRIVSGEQDGLIVSHEAEDAVEEAAAAKEG